MDKLFIRSEVLICNWQIGRQIKAKSAPNRCTVSLTRRWRFAYCQTFCSFKCQTSNTCLVFLSRYDQILILFRPRFKISIGKVVQKYYCLEVGKQNKSIVTPCFPYSHVLDRKTADNQLKFHRSSDRRCTYVLRILSARYRDVRDLRVAKLAFRLNGAYDMT